MLNNLCDVREHRGEIVLVAGDQADFAFFFAGQQPVAVVLDLVDPVIVTERLTGRGEHRTNIGKRRSPALCIQRGAGLANCLAGIVTATDLFDGQTREHRVLRQHGVLAFANIGVAFLDEEPVFLVALGFDQRPAAAELVAVHVEQQLAGLEAFADVLNRFVTAPVPDDDRTGAVVAFGDQPLEVNVVDRMVFGLDGQAFVCGIR